jgi:hypothetical protein
MPYLGKKRGQQLSALPNLDRQSLGLGVLSIEEARLHACPKEREFHENL